MIVYSMDARKENMVSLREDGYTLQEIGYLYQISRERVRQIIGNTGWTKATLYEEGYRRCYRCKETLPEEDFYTEKCHVCIQCTKEKQKEIMLANPQWFRKGGKYYQKQSCRQKTHYLVKTGKLKKGECEMKGADCHGRIEAHHYAGYDHPELVKWYCNKHHREIHNAVPFGRKLDKKLGEP